MINADSLSRSGLDGNGTRARADHCATVRASGRESAGLFRGAGREARREGRCVRMPARCGGVGRDPDAPRPRPRPMPPRYQRRHMAGYRVGGSVGKLPDVAAANCGGLSVMPTRFQEPPTSSAWRNVTVKHRPMGSSRDARPAPHRLARHTGRPRGSGSAAGDVRRSRAAKFTMRQETHSHR
jgi:hypothetical protein